MGCHQSALVLGTCIGDKKVKILLGSALEKKAQQRTFNSLSYFELVCIFFLANYTLLLLVHNPIKKII